MFELQQILHDIAQKGSESPFEGPAKDPYSSSLRLKRTRAASPKKNCAVQLSLF